MFSRKSNTFFLSIAVLVMLFGLMFAHAAWKDHTNRPYIQEKRNIVKKLGLSDLCLFTDARYTRHPSVADLNTPFQDYPMSFEHFPSGSLLTAPPHLKRYALD